MGGINFPKFPETPEIGRITFPKIPAPPIGGRDFGIGNQETVNMHIYQLSVFGYAPDGAVAVHINDIRGCGSSLLEAAINYGASSGLAYTHA